MFKFRTKGAPGNWNTKVSRLCDCLHCRDAFHAIDSLWSDVEAQRDGDRNVPSWWLKRQHSWKSLHMYLHNPFTQLVPRITDSGCDLKEITRHAQTRWGDE